MNTETRKSDYCGTFYFDPEDLIYADHFPSCPIVPGTLIVKAFVEAVRQNNGARPSIVENFRFLRFVSPGQYEFRISSEKTGFFCKLLDPEQQVLATGTVRM